MIMRALAFGLVLAGPGAAMAQASMAETLRRDIAAVLGEGADVRIMLIEQAHGVASQRTLTVGDAYRDGWTLRQATGKAVVLAKGKDTVTVDLGDLAAKAVADAPAASGAMVNAALTNADKNGLPAAGKGDGSPTPKPDLADLQRRAAAGDERAQYALQERESPRFEEDRERLIARGQINAVRMNDGLEPLGPDVVASRDAAGLDTTGYFVGYAPDGTQLMFRTRALYEASKQGR